MEIAALSDGSACNERITFGLIKRSDRFYDVLEFGVAELRFEARQARRGAARGMDVGRDDVLHGPSGGGQEVVDVLAGELLGGGHGCLRRRPEDGVETIA